MESLTADSFQFPAFLCSSDPRTARKSWRQLLRKAWKAGSFHDALASQRMCDVRSDNCDILFEYSPRGIIKLPLITAKWWVSYSGDIFPIRGDDLQHSEVLRAQDLLREGLTYPWYAVGMIGKHADLPWLFGAEQDVFFQNQTEVLRSVASALAYWLPELTFLSDRLTQSWWDHSRTVPNKHVLPDWVMKLCISFCMAGHKMPPLNGAWTGSFNQHLGDPAKFLLHYGLIEQSSSGRYRLS